MSNERWYVAQTQPQQEAYALNHIQRQGFAALLPMLETPKRLEPLFPSYLFVSFDSQSPLWPRLTSTRGVKRLLGRDAPLPVPRGYVESLQPVLRQGAAPVREAWQPGVTVVRVSDGPFAGHTGLYTGDAGARVKVLLALFGRNAVVSVPVSACVAA